jgi:hypothetical protein
VVLFAVVSLLVVITFAWEFRSPEARRRARWDRRKRPEQDSARYRVDWDDE